MAIFTEQIEKTFTEHLVKIKKSFSDKIGNVHTKVNNLGNKWEMCDEIPDKHDSDYINIQEKINKIEAQLNAIDVNSIIQSCDLDNEFNMEKIRNICDRNHMLNCKSKTFDIDDEMNIEKIRNICKNNRYYSHVTNPGLPTTNPVFNDISVSTGDVNVKSPMRSDVDNETEIIMFMDSNAKHLDF